MSEERSSTRSRTTPLKSVPSKLQARSLTHSSRNTASENRPSGHRSQPEIIDIATTDDETLGAPPPKHNLITPRTSNKIRSKAKLSTPRKSLSSSTTPRAIRRRIVITSSDSEPDSKAGPLRSVQQSLLTPKRIFKDTVIVLTDSSDDEDVKPHQPTKISISGNTPTIEMVHPCLAHDEWAVDESILVLDEPRSARKPLPRPFPPKGKKPLLARLPSLPSDDEIYVTTSDSSHSNHHRSPPVTRPSRPGSRSTPLLNPAISVKTPQKRRGKKAAAETEQARREAYAFDLFNELNSSVFRGELPHTPLIWSKRLLTTAGRASWNRSKATGQHITTIELSTKVVDSDERIRNTLSHEMCHLASWIISKEPKEHHGGIFKGWAAEIMRKRKDIKISTRHSYDIAYKYEWQCVNCSKVYGRHSKSIDTSAVRCGACKEGKLEPKFETRTPRAIGAKKGGPPATAWAEDSPDNLADLMEQLILPDIELE